MAIAGRQLISKYPHMITVVNKRTYRPDPKVPGIYIGRGSALGNIYTHVKDRPTKANAVVDTPDEAIRLYRMWLLNKLDDRHSPQSALFHKIIKAASMGDIALICYCAPKPCHGDIIKHLVENYID
jgi:hypothetical protein